MSSVKIQRMDPVQCDYCKSYRITTVGFNAKEGYLCQTCNHFKDIQTGEVIRVIKVKNLNSGSSRIFKSDLTFEDTYKKAVK